MINACVVSNGIEGIENMFRSNQRVSYTLLPIGPQFNPDFSPFDLLIVPNGTDNIAMFNIKHLVAEFLNAGKMMFCFDGWFTDWVPGNTWIMDNAHKTIDIRYRIVQDRYKVFEGIDLHQFIFSNGISGWWACGHIQAAPGADIILEDTWQQPIMVLDEVSTNGTMLLTASGPMADMLFGTNDDGQDSWQEVGRFYQKLISWAETKIHQPKTIDI